MNMCLDINKMYLIVFVFFFSNKQSLYFKGFITLKKVLIWFFLGVIFSIICDLSLSFLYIIKYICSCISVDDHSRVVLVNTSTDYINANYIDVSSCLKDNFRSNLKIKL